VSRSLSWTAPDRVGDSWRARYDSLTLFTPRQFSALPGLNLDGNRELYPGRDEFAGYLQRYASNFEFPIRLNTRVVRLCKDDGVFNATLDDGSEIRASEVIVATGGFQQALKPAVARQFGSGVLQLTTQTYRNPHQLPEGPVLIVGDGASGRDIAAEAAQSQSTILSTGKPRRLFPERVFGKSVWVVAERIRRASGARRKLDRPQVEAVGCVSGQGQKLQCSCRSWRTDRAAFVRCLRQRSQVCRRNFGRDTHGYLGGGLPGRQSVDRHTRSDGCRWERSSARRHLACAGHVLRRQAMAAQSSVRAGHGGRARCRPCRCQPVA
jgi:cation diffusion facilitator CzcD-associated flavoprotein CzcO